MSSVKHLKKYIAVMSFFLMATVSANDVEIVKVTLTKNSGSWRADVTLRHADEGWKHYADGWRLMDEKGKELGKRTLFHPHVNEQPFTRSLSGVHIGEDKNIIYVEAHDLKHGWSANRVKIDLRKKSGTKYKVTFR